MNALIINDEVITAEMLRDSISWEELGISEVFLAFSADEARTVFLGHPVDIYLCDIEMPGEDGIQLIRWIKSQDIDSDCILLTCHADFEYAQEAVRLGCSDYQLLPARYEEITASIRRVLERRKERMKAEEYRRYGENWLLTQNSMLHEKGTRNTKESIAERCVRYIQEHISSPELSVQEMAGALYLNRVYLNRIFREEKGISIGQYIINRRMALAAHLLEDPELSIEAISEHVGYRSYSYFAGAFARFYGCSPSQYRKNSSAENKE